ncbi:unnamed protein product [Rhizoctonia solani]|uniref:Laminin domain protein n=1 Tax=Rhizoctonia solani TaxID=456999 RepID=A0A8H2XIY2_9AGAM|nr:unnamed protein product [Rhizoctonia solani]
MPSSSGNQVHSPPQLPLYLKNVYDLKPIVGVPSDEEVIGIHAVIRVANKVVDVEDMGDPTLLARLSEHLFGVQLARYRSKRAAVDTAYTPPSLPAHVSTQPGPVKGTSSEEDIIRAQSALRAYQQFSNIPSMFDPRVDMELSQRLFDIQMVPSMFDPRVDMELSQRLFDIQMAHKAEPRHIRGPRNLELES